MDLNFKPVDLADNTALGMLSRYISILYATTVNTEFIIWVLLPQVCQFKLQLHEIINTQQAID